MQLENSWNPNEKKSSKSMEIWGAEKRARLLERTCNRERSRRERDSFGDLGQRFRRKLRRQWEEGGRSATKHDVLALWVLEGRRCVGYEIVDRKKGSGRSSSGASKKNRGGKTRTKTPLRPERERCCCRTSDVRWVAAYGTGNGFI